MFMSMNTTVYLRITHHGGSGDVENDRRILQSMLGQIVDRRVSGACNNVTDDVTTCKHELVINQQDTA